MLHEGPQGLGDNVMPAFTDPVRIEDTDADGNLIGVRYEYPATDNHLLYDLQPLLENAGVDLVHNGHSHLWNRFVGDNGVTNYLETSNTGNSYGAYHELSGRTRPVPPEPWKAANYWSTGNPGGLVPQVPTENPHLAEDGTPLPFVQSNDHIVFTVLDTGAGEVISYVHDMREPDAAPVELDRFSLGRPDGSGDGIDLSVTVAGQGAPGELVWSVASTAPIDLGVAQLAGDRLAADGELHPVTVTDTRTAAPSWAVTAQVSDFAAPDAQFGAEHLGWTPQLRESGGGAVAGPVVNTGLSGGDGLSAPAVLGSAPAGHPVGTAELGADLQLRLPVDAQAGRYTGTLTMTAIG